MKQSDFQHPLNGFLLEETWYQNGDLFIQKTTGELLKYKSVPAYIFEGLMTSKNADQYYSELIESRFKCERIDRE